MKPPFIARQHRRRKLQRQRAEARAAIASMVNRELGLDRLKRDLMRELQSRFERREGRPN